MNTEYSRRVAQLEAEGLTTSDAQGVADAEKLENTKEISTDDAVAAFLARNGISYTVTNAGSRTRDGWDCDAWLFRFAKQGKQEEFEYFTGIGHRKQVKTMPAPAYRKGTLAYEEWARDAFRAAEPPAAGVLYSLIMDSSAIGQSFESWAADYGYDTDSRKAEGIYRECQQNADKLRRVFSAAEIEALSAMLQDY